MTLQFPGQMLRQAVPEISVLTCSPTPSFFFEVACLAVVRRQGASVFNPLLDPSCSALTPAR
jgi:hypothetical protein